VVHRDRGTWEETTIRELPAYLRAGDVIVANDTRVFPARLLGRRDPSGGRVECLLLERENEAEWSALVHPGQKLKAGARMIFEDPTRALGVRIDAEVLARKFYGRRIVRLTVAPTDGQSPLDIDDALDVIGHVPLPRTSRVRTRRPTAIGIRRCLRATAAPSRRPQPVCILTRRSSTPSARAARRGRP
jgi:S-adenosylmethionine:tRNA ribosyltransferase-isomerase